jgi:hypothetical protein
MQSRQEDAIGRRAACADLCFEQASAAKAHRQCRLPPAKYYSSS